MKSKSTLQIVISATLIAAVVALTGCSDSGGENKTKNSDLPNESPLQQYLSVL